MTEKGREEPRERALEAARREEFSRISKGLIHTFSNALQVIRSGLELLATDLKEKPEALSLLERLKEAQEHMTRLIEDFRDYSSPLRLQIRENCLGEVLEEAWGQLAPLRKDRQARLGAWGSGLDLRCSVDRGATEKLLRFILENVLKSRPDPVEIEVEWSEGAIEGRRAVVLALRYKGFRIPEEEKEAFFEPFRRTAAGASMDLAIARRIARAQGGDIAIEDRAPLGQAILVILPREPAIGESGNL